MVDAKKHFREKLKEARKAKGLSQEKLSRLCGFDRTYIGKIERGKKSPSLNTVQKVADCLGIEVYKLFKP